MDKSSAVLRVWLIDSGLPGHTVQVDTIGRILHDRTGADCEWVKAKLRLRGPLRSLTRSLVDWIPVRMIPWLIRMMYGRPALPKDLPDLVVSSNSPTASICRLIARMSGAKTIFLGELHPPRSRWFDIVVVPVEMDLPNALLAPLAQTGQSPEKAAEAARTFWPSSQPKDCWTMIIGGDGKSHTYQPDEWNSLGQEMSRLAKEHGIRWLVSTSRRTGGDNEALLKEALDPACVYEAIWWATEPKKGLAAYIYAGEKVFVTRDSLTMISEVVAVKGRAEVVYPSNFRLGPESAYERYLGRLAKERRLGAHPINRIELDGILPPLTSVDEEQQIFIRSLLARIDRVLGKIVPPRSPSLEISGKKAH